MTGNFPDLVYAMMCSAPIRSSSAKQAAAVVSGKWPTARDLIGAVYDEVRATLTDNGYARFDIQGSGRLLMMSRQVVERGMPKTADEVAGLHGCGWTTVKVLREDCGWEI